MNKKKTIERHLEIDDQILESTDETHAQPERITRTSKKQVPAQEYPADVPTAGISEPVSKDYAKEDLAPFESKEEIKTGVYGLSKPKRRKIKGKIFHDQD